MFPSNAQSRREICRFIFAELAQPKLIDGQEGTDMNGCNRDYSVCLRGDGELGIEFGVQGRFPCVLAFTKSNLGEKLVAERSGNISVGDSIIQVNEHKVLNMPLFEVEKLFQTCKRPITLVLRGSLPLPVSEGSRSGHFNYPICIFEAWVKVSQFSRGFFSAYENVYCVIVPDVGTVGLKSEADVDQLSTAPQMVIHPCSIPLYDISQLEPQVVPYEDGFSHTLNVRIGTPKKYRTLRFHFEDQPTMSAFTVAMDIMEAARIHLEQCNDLGILPVSQWLSSLYSRTYANISIVDDFLSAQQIKCLANTVVSGICPCFMNMESLEIAYVHLGNVEMENLNAWILKNPSLKSILLQHCGIDDESLNVLLVGLRTTRLRLKVLDLSFNDISSATKQIAKFVSSVSSIETLSLANNQIKPCDMYAISEMAKIGRLCSLDISGNPIGDDGIAIFASDVHQYRFLETISLRNCKLTNAGATCLINAVQDHKISSISSIDLEGNDFGEDLVTRFVSAIRSQSNLSAISFGGETLTINSLQDCFVYGYGFQTDPCQIGSLRLVRNVRPAGSSIPARIDFFIRTYAPNFDVDMFTFHVSQAVYFDVSHFMVIKLHSFGKLLVVITMDIMNVPNMNVVSSEIDKNENLTLRDLIVSAYNVNAETYFEEKETGIRKALERIGVYRASPVHYNDEKNRMHDESEFSENNSTIESLSEKLFSPLRSSQSTSSQDQHFMDEMAVLDQILEGVSSIESVDTIVENKDTDDTKYARLLENKDSAGRESKDFNDVPLSSAVELGIQTASDAGSHDIISYDDKRDFVEKSGLEFHNEAIVEMGNSSTADTLTKINPDFVLRLVMDRVGNIEDKPKINSEVQRQILLPTEDLKSLLNIENRIRGIILDREKIKEIKLHRLPPEELPLTARHSQLCQAVFTRDCSKVREWLTLVEQTSEGVWEKDVTTARRFIRQYESTLSSVEIAAAGSSEKLVGETIARAAKFNLTAGALNKCVDCLVELCGLRKDDSVAVDYRNMLDAVLSRNIDRIQSAIADTDTLNQLVSAKPLIIVAEDLLVNLETANTLLEDAVRLSSVGRGNLSSLESALMYAAKVNVAKGNYLWTQANAARKLESAKVSVEHYMSLAMQCSSFAALDQYLKYAIDSSIESEVIDLVTNVCQMTSTLKCLLETSLDLSTVVGKIKDGSISATQSDLEVVISILNQAQSYSVFVSGRHVPFEFVSNWLKTQQNEDGSENVSHAQPSSTPKDEIFGITTHLSDGKIVIEKSANFCEDRRSDANMEDHIKVLNDLNEAVKTLNVTKFNGIMACMKETGDISNPKLNLLCIELQLNMGVLSNGPISKMFDEALFTSVSCRLSSPIVSIAIILSSLQQIIVGDFVHGSFVVCDSSLLGPTVRSHDRYLMNLGEDSPVRLDKWMKLRSCSDFQLGKGIGSHGNFVPSSNQSMLCHTTLGIPNSLTRLKTWETAEAISIFYAIQNCLHHAPYQEHTHDPGHHMKHASAYFSQIRLLTSRLSLASESLCEEMYLQLSKQLHRNKYSREMRAGWEIFSIWLRTRIPSKSLSKVLRLFAYEQASLLYKKQGSNVHTIYRACRFCAVILTTYDRFALMRPPSERLYEYTLGSPRVIIVIFPDETSREYLVAPFTTAGQFLEDICADMHYEIPEMKSFQLGFEGGQHLSSRHTVCSIESNEDVLWACGAYALLKKKMLSIDHSKVVFKVYLRYAAIIRHVAARHSSDSFGLHQAASELISGKHKESLECYAFLSLLLARSQGRFGVEEGNVAGAVTQAIPPSILNITGTINALIRAGSRYADSIRTIEPSICRKAFIGYVKCLPMYGAHTFKDILVEINSGNNEFSGRGVLAINGAEIYFLRKSSEGLVFNLPFSNITGWYFDESPNSCLIIAFDFIQLKIKARVNMCLRICKSISSFLEALLRNNLAADDDPETAFIAWNKEFHQHFDTRPGMSPLRKDKMYDSLCRNFHIDWM